MVFYFYSWCKGFRFICVSCKCFLLFIHNIIHMLIVSIRFNSHFLF